MTVLLAPAAGLCHHPYLESAGDDWRCAGCGAVFADRHEAGEATWEHHVATALAVIA